METKKTAKKRRKYDADYLDAPSILSEKKVEDIDIYSAEINHLFHKKREMNTLYDQETRHGIYGTEQKKWKAKIERELMALKSGKSCWKESNQHRSESKLNYKM